MLDIETLNSLLNYDPLTGIFTWKAREGNSRSVNVFNSRYADKVAGSVQIDSTNHKQLVIWLEKRSYKAHRVAWVMSGNSLKSEEVVDHINCDSLDNRICNLRLADRFQSARNKTKTVKNSSGYKGVSVKAKTGRWVAQINHLNKKYHIGTYDTPEEAYAAYCAKAKELHGEFARLV